jgi:uncharacterized protein
MQFQEDQSRTRIRINAWDKGTIKINGKQYQHNMLLSCNEIVELDVPAYDDLTEQFIEQICQLKPEVLLLGSGEKQCFPEPSLRAKAMSYGISIEVMDTMAACRTFTLLSGEGRNVYALLYMH